METIEDTGLTNTKPSAEEMSKLISVMKSLPQADWQIKHHFSEGVYVRERFAPANTLIVGKIHRKSCMTVLLSGALSVWDGEKTSKYEAPHIFHSLPGERRITYSHTPTIIITIHPTNETDIDKIEDEVVFPDKLPADLEKMHLKEGDELCHL